LPGRGILVTPELEKIQQLENELHECRRHAEDLRRSYQRAIDFLGTTSDIMWEANADLRLKTGLEVVAGAHHGDVELPDHTGFMGKTIVEIIGEAAIHHPAVAGHLGDLQARRPFRSFVWPFRQPDGTLRWNESSGNPVFDQAGIFQGYRGTTRDITQRVENEAKIAFMARRDALTNLPNRILFQERIDLALTRTGPGSSFAVMCLDLDRFKSVNDTLGHSVGDALLKAVAERLSACLRNIDTVARVGGDEFTIVQIGLETPEHAGALAQRIVDMIGEPYVLEGHHVTTRVTIGIAVSPADGASSSQLLKNADIALYRAKREEPGSWRFFAPEMSDRLEARHKVETELRFAIPKSEFEIFYQPVYNVKSGKISSFEALLRWRHPVRGIVMPDEFIPIAEETGLVVPIGEWVLRQACAEAAGWPERISLAINLSPAQFKSKVLVERVRESLAAAGLPASRLELEITESVLMQNTESTLAVLNNLRKIGVRISMDDFGTGYSSLSYLRRFPFDKIKIERSFIRDLTKREGASAIVQAIAGLGGSLNLAITAEGVETQEQFAIVKAEGCTEVQGYLFSRPRPAGEIPLILEETSICSSSGRIPVGLSEALIALDTALHLVESSAMAS
jgi:diguanylate cyclase (GGDEF)-like protein